ncbi:MAG TPA: hypothetical protein DDW52_23190 [Planctomycetaceae bacterium]|nr:hypothetical protein [Planctomycetaceae bacterium]
MGILGTEIPISEMRGVRSFSMVLDIGIHTLLEDSSFPFRLRSSVALSEQFGGYLSPHQATTFGSATFVRSSQRGRHA